MLYINGRPYVVREADKPFQNLEYTGIDRSRVEDMEARLKRDVLDEVRKEPASAGGVVPAAARNTSVGPKAHPHANGKGIVDAWSCSILASRESNCGPRGLLRGHADGQDTTQL